MLIKQEVLSYLSNQPSLGFLETFLDAFQQFFILLDDTNQVVACNQITHNTFGDLADCNTIVSAHVLPLAVTKETVLTLSDQTITVQWHKSSITLPDNNHCYSLLIGQDISEVSRLKKHNFHLNYILKKVPGYVFWKDINSTLMGCNENFSNQVGLSTPEDIIGKKDYDLPWSQEQTERFLQDDKNVVLKGLSKLNFEETQTQADGTKAHLLTSKVPIYDQEGGIQGILGMYVDITTLIKAKEKAEAANNSKSDFIANMSHDLRTPIAGMLGVTQYMSDEANQAKSATGPKAQAALSHLIKIVEDHSSMLNQATHRLLTLFNGILEVVKLESGKTIERIEEFNLESILNDTVALLQPVAKDKQLMFSYTLDSAIPPILKGAHLYLSRILINLVSNALKFTDQGFVKITTTLDKTQMTCAPFKIGDTVVINITVQDTGIGIPKDKTKVIFEHFSRLTASYKGTYQGAGLGLYMVKRYVEAMNGQIHVDSTVGEGASFTITLPFTVSEQIPTTC